MFPLGLQAQRTLALCMSLEKEPEHLREYCSFVSRALACDVRIGLLGWSGSRQLANGRFTASHPFCGL